MTPTERLMVEKLGELAERISAIETRMARAEGRRTALFAGVGAGGAGVVAAVQAALQLLGVAS